MKINNELITTKFIAELFNINQVLKHQFKSMYIITESCGEGNLIYGDRIDTVSLSICSCTMKTSLKNLVSDCENPALIVYPEVLYQQSGRKRSDIVAIDVMDGGDIIVTFTPSDDEKLLGSYKVCKFISWDGQTDIHNDITFAKKMEDNTIALMDSDAFMVPDVMVYDEEAVNNILDKRGNGMATVQASSQYPDIHLYLSKKLTPNFRTSKEYRTLELKVKVYREEGCSTTDIETLLCAHVILITAKKELVKVVTWNRILAV